MGALLNSIAQVQGPDRLMNQMQQNIITAVNPVLANPLVNGTILVGIVLLTGTNIVSHTLGRTLQGWFLVRQRSSASLYDTQDTNTTPSRTLVLVTSANVTVDIYVF